MYWFYDCMGFESVDASLTPLHDKGGSKEIFWISQI